MKVTTDACLFGAWIANKLLQRHSRISNVSEVKTVLEIGTGTGLLSLMLAQKNDVVVDTVEIDAAACEQAKENVAATAWSQRIRVLCGDARQLVSVEKYDLIISNPPFFEKQLRSGNNEINMARHHDTLSLEQLLQVASGTLSSEGELAVLLPYDRSDYFIKLADSNHFHLLSRLDVKQSTNHAHFRSMLYLQRQSTIRTETTEMIIKDGEKYTDDFTFLLKDYYLKL